MRLWYICLVFIFGRVLIRVIKKIYFHARWWTLGIALSLVWIFLLLPVRLSPRLPMLLRYGARSFVIVRLHKLQE